MYVFGDAAKVVADEVEMEGEAQETTEEGGEGVVVDKDTVDNDTAKDCVGCCFVSVVLISFSFSFSAVDSAAWGGLISPVRKSGGD